MKEAPIIPFDSIRDFAANELAKEILARAHAREALLGALGPDVTVTRCALCSGRLPPIGRAAFVIDDSGLTRWMHRGCAITDIAAWAHGPQELCEFGCELCMGGDIA